MGPVGNKALYYKCVQEVLKKHHTKSLCLQPQAWAFLHTTSVDSEFSQCHVALCLLQKCQCLAERCSACNRQLSHAFESQSQSFSWDKPPLPSGP